MIDDDVKSRIERLYRSAQATIDNDISSRINVEHKKTEKGGTISISFSNMEDESEILNQIFLVISNLAKLKDHLGKKLKSRGIDSKLLIDKINNSEHLKLIIDLDNLEKHGPGRESWSGRFPQLTNVARGITQKDIKSSRPAVFEFSTSGQVRWNDNTVVVITGTIVDKDEKIICSYNTLVDKSIDAWEVIIQEFNLRY